MAPGLERTVERLAGQAAERYFGKYRGTVIDNADPNRQGRIMAQVPGVLGEASVGWALPAFPFAGDGHGMVMLPEVGSMVWIESDAGNLDYPIWSGAFFAGSERPDPNNTGARTIVSVTGHKVVLDDDAGKLVVEHAQGAKLEMTATEITLEVGASKIVLGPTSITFNNGVLKVGAAGVSLAQGAMTLGVPPT